jgi:hypothetical protein
LPDDADGILPGPPPAAVSRDWGPAALATAGILLVAGFPGLIVIMVLAMNWDRLIGAGDTDLTAVIGYAGYTAGFLATLMSVVMALRGLIGRGRHGRPVAWAVPAGVIGLIAVIVWGIALYSWHKCIEDVNQRHRPPAVIIQPWR